MSCQIPDLNGNPKAWSGVGERFLLKRVFLDDSFRVMLWLVALAGRLISDRTVLGFGSFINGTYLGFINCFAGSGLIGLVSLLCTNLWVLYSACSLVLTLLLWTTPSSSLKFSLDWPAVWPFWLRFSVDKAFLMAKFLPRVLYYICTGTPVKYCSAGETPRFLLLFLLREVLTFELG